MINFNKRKFWFNKKEKSRKFGFSLIEMVVVVGSLGIIIVAVISTILVTFRSQNKVKTNNKISENGRSILMELRRNVFNSEARSVFCGVGIGTSVVMKNQKDKNTITLECSGGNITSKSETSTGINLNSNEVTVTNCEEFAACQPAGANPAKSVTFNFGLRSITTGVGSSQLFNTTVTTRN